MDLFIMMLVLWLALPLMLIPMCIIYGKRKKRLEKFIRELLNGGRISGYEYQNLKTEVKDSVSAAVKKVQTVSVSKEAVPAAVQKIAEKAKELPYVVQTAALNERRGAMPVSVLFGIGVAFVILAGFIFSTAIWVYLSDSERTGVIALAGCIFFGVSVLAQKKFRLENTSNAFYMLGSVFSVISFITAGFFGLFGDWFAVDGEGGCILFAAAFTALAGFSYIGAKLYRKLFYHYVSTFSLLISATLIIVHCFDEYRECAIALNLFGIVVSAVCYSLRQYASADIPKAVMRTVAVMRAGYGCIAATLFFEGLYEWRTESFIIALVYLAEFTFYGITKQNRLVLAVQSIFALTVCYELCGGLNEHFGEDDVWLFIFAMTAVLLALVYRYFKPLYSGFACKSFITVSFIAGMILIDDAEAFGYGTVVMLAVEALVFVAALDMRALFNRIYRFLIPVPMLVVAVYAQDQLTEKFGFMCESFMLVMCAVLFAAAAFLCRTVIKGDRRFVQIKYSFEFYAGAALVGAFYSDYTKLSLILTAIVSVLLIAEIHTSAKNIHSLIPLYSLFGAISCFVSASYNDYKAESDTLVFISIILCAILTFLSRMFYSRNIRNTSGDRSHWDIFQAGIIFCHVLLEYYYGTIFGYDEIRFIIYIELAVFAANLYRKDHNKYFNSWAATIAALLLAIALIDRPFMVIDNAVVTSKIVLIIIAAFGFAAGRIWRRNERFSARISSGVYMLTYILLLFDALINETLFNTLLVLCTSLAIMLYAFMRKSKKWFLVSAIGLAGLTFYITKDFLAEIDWWVYLLLAGMLLILIASASEYFKGKGSELRVKAGRFFEDWQW